MQGEAEWNSVITAVFESIIIIIIVIMIIAEWIDKPEEASSWH